MNTAKFIKAPLRPTQCAFCATGTEVINYKDSEMLRKYLNPQGKIQPRRRTGTCALHQRLLARAIKRARFLAILPYTIR